MRKSQKASALLEREKGGKEGQQVRSMRLRGLDRSSRLECVHIFYLFLKIAFSVTTFWWPMTFKFYLIKLVQQIFIEHYYLVNNLLIFGSYNKTFKMATVHILSKWLNPNHFPLRGSVVKEWGRKDFNSNDCLLIYLFLTEKLAII